MGRRAENQGFTCVVCGHAVAPITSGTIRDHCPHCLCSLHVDELPGDRSCDCHGVLRPTATDYAAKKGHVLVYACDACGATRRNRVADDDDLDALLAVQRRQTDDLLW